MADKQNMQQEQAEQAFQLVGTILLAALGRFAMGYLGGAAIALPAIDPKTDDSLLTQPEARTLLKVSPTTFRNLQKEHDFGRVVVGGRPKYSTKKINIYLNKESRRKE